MQSPSKDSAPIALFEAEGREQGGMGRRRLACLPRLCRPPTARHPASTRATIGKHRRQTQPGLSKLRGGIPCRRSGATTRSANDGRNANLGWMLRCDPPGDRLGNQQTARQQPSGMEFIGIHSSRCSLEGACPARCAPGPGSSAEKGRRGGGRPGRPGCGSRLAGESSLTSESHPSPCAGGPRFRIASRRVLARQNLRGSPLRKRPVSRPAQ